MPTEARAAALLDAAAIILDRTITDPVKRSEASTAYRKRALNNVGKPLKNGDIGLRSRYHSRTQELVYRLEDVCQSFMAEHHCRTNFPIYDATASLMFEALLARGIDLTWQDGLRGLLINLYPPSEPQEDIPQRVPAK